MQTRSRVFINGCMGSVGRCAIQIARHVNAAVSGACGTDDIAEANALGAGEVVDYKVFDAERFRGKFDIVLDAFGNLSASQCSTMLSDKGVALHISPTFSKMVSVTFARRNKLAFMQTDSQRLSKLGALATEGHLTLPVAKTVPLAQAIRALVELEMHAIPKGKVVVTPT